MTTTDEPTDPATRIRNVRATIAAEAAKLPAVDSNGRVVDLTGVDTSTRRYGGEGDPPHEAVRTGQSTPDDS